MRNKLVKITLAASVLLALAFTISCSDDDKDTWLSCKEAKAVYDKCDKKYEADYKACNSDDDYEACLNRVNDKTYKCFMDGACSGNSLEVCMEHYDQQCSEDNR